MENLITEEKQLYLMITPALVGCKYFTCKYYYMFPVAKRSQPVYYINCWCYPKIHQKNLLMKQS